MESSKPRVYVILLIIIGYSAVYLTFLKYFVVPDMQQNGARRTKSMSGPETLASGKSKQNTDNKVSSNTTTIKKKDGLSVAESELPPKQKVEIQSPMGNTTMSTLTTPHGTSPSGSAVDGATDNDLRHVSLSEMGNKTMNTLMATHGTSPSGSVVDGEIMKQHKNESLSDVCKRTATPDKELVVSLIGSGVHDVYMNFYYSSILKHNISNMIFVATDPVACQQIAKELSQSVACFVAYEEVTSGKQSIYGSGDFNRKCQKRAKIVRDIIKLGYTVLASDIDIVFLKNPLPVLRELCTDETCDVAIQWNGFGEYNGGFLYVRPTAGSQLMYEQLVEHGDKHHSHDQASLNYVLKTFGTRVVKLDEKRFPAGPAFFRGRRGCPPKKRYNESIIVHNNFVISPTEKIYRLKTCSLWVYDGLDRYYTSTTRKYLVYSDGHQRGVNFQAVLNGFTIAFILSRTFILPSAVSHHFFNRIDAGKPRYHDDFAGKYRVPAFLDHPLLPAGVKESRSAVYCISGDAKSSNCKSANVTLQCDDPVGGPSEQEIQKWFMNEKASVLVITRPLNDLPRINYTHILGKLEHAFDGNREKHASIL